MGQPNGIIPPMKEKRISEKFKRQITEAELERDYIETYTEAIQNNISQEN